MMKTAHPVEAQRSPAVLKLHAWLAENFEPSHNNLPQAEVWYGGGGFMHLEFMPHHFGCYAILSAHASGCETGRVNIGTFTNAADIKHLIEALKRGKTR